MRAPSRPSNNRYDQKTGRGQVNALPAADPDEFKLPRVKFRTGDIEGQMLIDTGSTRNFLNSKILPPNVKVNAEEKREVKMAFSQTGQTLGSATVALSIGSLQIHEEESKFEVAPLFEDVMGILSFEWQRRHRVHLSWEDMEYYVEREPPATTVATIATKGSIAAFTVLQKHDEHEIQAPGESPSAPCANESQAAIDLDEQAVRAARTATLSPVGSHYQDHD